MRDAYEIKFKPENVYVMDSTWRTEPILHSNRSNGFSVCAEKPLFRVRKSGRASLILYAKFLTGVCGWCSMCFRSGCGRNQRCKFDRESFLHLNVAVSLGFLRCVCGKWEKNDVFGFMAFFRVEWWFVGYDCITGSAVWCIVCYV